MRLKDVVILRNEKTTDTSKPYIALENIISWDAKYIESSIETEGTNSVFKPNDILFGKLRPYLAKGFIPSYEGICSTEFFVLKAKKGYYTQYLLYLLLSHSFIDYIKNQVAGVKMPRTNWETFSSIEVSIPSLEVQQRIVEYLEAKTTEIDKKIELLGKKRDAYNRLKTATINRAVTRGLDEHVKLKDTGIDWIGEIPVHWKTRRIKDEVEVNKLTLTESTSPMYKFRYIDISNVSSEGVISFIEEVYFYEAPSRARRIVQKGDIIVSTVRTYLKSIGMIDFDAKDVVVSTGFAVLSPIKSYSKYFYYLLRSNHLIDEICALSSGVSYPAIAATRIESINIPVPPLEEQKQIAAYLDERCAKIDEAVRIIDKQIDALKRLKRSLINEVVTGKRMV